jgi:hypothetical protein
MKIYLAESGIINRAQTKPRAASSQLLAYQSTHNFVKKCICTDCLLSFRTRYGIHINHWIPFPYKEMGI